MSEYPYHGATSRSSSSKEEEEGGQENRQACQTSAHGQGPVNGPRTNGFILVGGPLDPRGTGHCPSCPPACYVPETNNKRRKQFFLSNIVLRNKIMKLLNDMSVRWTVNRVFSHCSERAEYSKQQNVFSINLVNHQGEKD